MPRRDASVKRWEGSVRNIADAAPTLKPLPKPERVHPIVATMLCLCLASFPFEFPLRTFRWEIPTMTTALFLLTTLFQPRVCYFSRIPSSIWWLAGFMWTMAVALAVNGWFSLAETAQEIILFIQCVLFFWAAANLLRHDKVARAALWSFAVACVIRAALPFIGVGRTGEAVWTGGERITAFGQNANWSAKLLATGLIVLVGLMYAHQRAPKRLRWLALGAIGGVGIAIIDTGSRGGLLALAIGMLVFTMGRQSTMWSAFRNAFIGIAAIVFLGVVAMKTEVMRNRFEDTASTGNMAGREVLYPTLWGMFLEKPWTGWGQVNNQFELAQRIAEQNKLRRDSHNLILELLTTTGILGTIPFLMALGLIVRGAWRARHGPHGITPVALLAVHALGAMSGNPISTKLFWLVLAYAVAAAGAEVVAPVVEVVPALRRSWARA
jgi:O-antigen ligase